MGVALFTTAGAGAAHAEEPITPPEQGVVELVQLDDAGNWIPVDVPPPLDLEAPQESSSTPADSGAATPYLVSPSQWTSCFMFNLSGTVFATYWWVQGNRAVTLECGNSGYGYKHLIAKAHDADWTKIYNNAIAKGWTASAYGATTWDDLMNVVLANQLGVPGPGYQTNPATQKACTYSTYGLYNTSTGKIVYSFGAEAVWSMNNNRIITSYPSSRGYCVA